MLSCGMIPQAGCRCCGPVCSSSSLSACCWQCGINVGAGNEAPAAGVTDWGESLALVYELRREIKRLSEENLRLWEERAELVKVFGRVVEFLQQEVGQISGKSLGPKSETTKPRRDSGITRGSEVWEANGNPSSSVRGE